MILFCVAQIGGTYTKPVLLPTEVVIGALGKIQVSITVSPCGFVTFTYLRHECQVDIVSFSPVII